MDDLKQLYQEMADLTLPECGKNCRMPYSCCEHFYCISTMEYAKQIYGIEIEPVNNPIIPLLGPEGCVVEPYLRPLCTLHVCSINSSGFKPGDDEFNRKYFELRNKIELLEFTK